MRFLTKPSGRSLGATVATVALTGALSVGMISMEAKPAHAILPVIPVILGGTAAASGVTLSGAAISLGITTAAAGLAMAITQPGAFDWLTNWDNPFDGHNTDANGNPVDTTIQHPYEPVPTREGSSDPMFNDYAWTSPHMNVTSMTESIINSASTVSVAYSLTGTGSSADNVRGLLWATGTCRHPTDPTVAPRTVSRVVQGGLAQHAAPSSVMNINCNSLNMPAASWTGAVPGKMVELSIRPATTKEKITVMTEGSSFYNTYRWAPYANHWKDSSFEYANPQYKTEVICVAPDGTRVTISATSPVGGPVAVPSCAAAGLGVGESMVVGFADGDKIRQPIFTSTPAYADQYAECDPVFGQVCKFQIYVDGKPCVIGSPACQSWAGLYKVNPVRVQCMYGTHVVDMSGCAILEGAYLPGGSPAVDTNIDGNPDTWTEPYKVPGYVPHIIPSPGAAPIPDPEAPPEPVPGPIPNPNPAPDVSGDPVGDPGPGGDPGPEVPPTEPVPPVVAIPPTMDGANCWGKGSASFNPLEWVFTPVLCALERAFVPKTDVTGRVTELKDLVADKPPLSWLNTPMVGPGGGGCPNWVITLPGVSKNVVCDSSFTGAIVASRGPLFALVATAMLWPLLRSIWYAAIPILRVSPGSSK